MAIFVSLVGFQPSAVAIAVATWSHYRGAPSQMIFLATPQTKSVANRLQTWRADLPSEIISIGGSPAAISSELQQLLEKLKGEPLVFLGDPGPNFLIASVARQLPRNTIFLHADSHALHICQRQGDNEQWDSSPLVDLGFDSLLALYELQWKTDRQAAFPVLDACLRRANISVPSRVHRRVTFKNIEHPPFALTFESRGQLFGLFEIVESDYLQKTREIFASEFSFNGLRPRIGVLSPNPYVLERVHSAGHLAINSQAMGLRRLRQWVNGDVPPPGHASTAAKEDATAKIQAAQGKPMKWQPFRLLHHTMNTKIQPYEGKPRKAPNNLDLVVCLGLDPSATLVSLATHKPKQAWVFYDAQNPTIVENAHRLRQSAKFLPVERVEFLPTDHLGKGITSTLTSLMRSGRSYRVDVTPGTKAQGCALARWTDGELWSQHTQTSEATPLVAAKLPVRLTAPSLEVCTIMNGGRLKDGGDLAKELSVAERQFLRIFVRFLAHWLDEHPSSQWRLNQMIDRRCPHGSAVVTHQDSRWATLTVKFAEEVVEGVFPASGGKWLEQVMLNALTDAGANEVRVGVEWAWSEEIQQRLTAAGKSGHRSEIDAIARFGHRYLAVSCKVGKDVSLLRAAQREIEAESRLGLGRFCVPALVCPWVDPSMRTHEERGRLRRDAVLLDLKTIAEPETFKRTLDTIFKSRSTFVES
jgi:hypothetical protein